MTAPPGPSDPSIGPNPPSGLHNFHINLGSYFDSAKNKEPYVDPVPVSCPIKSKSSGTQSKNFKDVGKQIGFSWGNDDAPRV